MKISIILPTRNNLKYLKWSYDSIRKNQANHIVQICVADDASTDGTREWLESRSRDDDHLDFIINDSGHRLGHTILYDRLVTEVAEHELCMIYHADMYLCPGALDAIENHMYSFVHTDRVENGFEIIKNTKTITSLTRIEPPLHPPGPEKILQDFGTEPENFNEDVFLNWLYNIESIYDTSNVTEGIFAPWAFWKSEFQEIGGHDPIFAPQSAEDSDIFNRFALNETKFIQTWKGFVYHMTCRGSRFNPTLTNPGTNSIEWELQNIKSRRNFARKWHQPTLHDIYMKPIILPVYNIGFVVENCTLQLLRELEPWCDNIYCNIDPTDYIKSEQVNTRYNLTERIKSFDVDKSNDIILYFDGRLFINQLNDNMNFIQGLFPAMLEDSGVVGLVKYGIFTINIKTLTPVTNTLIKLHT